MVAIEPPILGYTTRGEYRYNGLNWRVGKLADTDNDGALDEQRLIYYTANWQIAEERVTDRSSWSWDPTTGIDRFVQYIWGPRYIDDLIARRVKDENDGDTGVYDEILYHLTDAMFSTRVVADNAKNIKERISYDAYGEARHSWQGDVDGDGDVDPVDANRIAQLLGKPTTPVAIHDAAYEVQADLNADGVIDSDDEDLADTIRAALGNGELSSTGNVIGWDGYVFNPELQHYIVRHRHYSPEWGRWLERDPAGYVDGLNLQLYGRGRPVVLWDPLGLQVTDEALNHVVDSKSSKAAKNEECRRTKCRSFIVNDFGDDKDWVNWAHRICSRPYPGDAIDATSVQDAVRQIIDDLEGDECICNLQFWGHGGEGAFKIGSDWVWKSDFGEDSEFAELLPFMCDDGKSKVVVKACWSFAGEDGKELAKAMTEFFGCTTGGHNEAIGYWLRYPGYVELCPGQEPTWEDSGEDDGKKSAKKGEKTKTGKETKKGKKSSECPCE